MAALDREKERLGYLKFWLGVVVVTDISLAGWLITASDAAIRLTFALALAGLVLLSTGILLLHRKIEYHIDQTGRL